MVENTNEVKCPACETDINGEYFNCNLCENTGVVDKAVADKYNADNNFWNDLLNKNKSWMIRS